jgi:hypothetical protein
MTDSRDPVTRAVELLVYAPIGAGLFLLDEAPGFLEAAIERGRTTVTPHVTTARSTGVVALAFGVPMLRRKVEARVARALGRPVPEPPEPEPELAVDTDVPAPPATPPAQHTTPYVPEPAPAPTVARSVPANGAPKSADLPIPGYDELSASQVVERLNGLAPRELDAVHAYETANRQRRTILGKIEQLAASPGV